MWDHWGRFSPSTSVFPTISQSTDFSTLNVIRSWYNRLNSGRRTKWSQSQIYRKKLKQNSIASYFAYYILFWMCETVPLVFFSAQKCKRKCKILQLFHLRSEGTLVSPMQDVEPIRKVDWIPLNKRQIPAPNGNSTALSQRFYRLI
jgi:hypothetical protein